MKVNGVGIIPYVSILVMEKHVPNQPDEVILMFQNLWFSMMTPPCHSGDSIRQRSAYK